MVISPRTAHSFRVLVIRYDIVIVGELFGGRWRISCPAPQSSGSEAYASLLAIGVFDILAVVRIFDPLHSTSYQPRFGNEFPATAGNRSVNGQNSFGRSLMAALLECLADTAEWLNRKIGERKVCRSRDRAAGLGAATPGLSTRNAASGVRAFWHPEREL